MERYETVDERLPIGLNYKDAWYDRVVIREMSGGDNQLLTSAEVTNNLAKGVTSLLNALIVRIYNSDNPELSINKVTREHLNEMFAGDRDACWIYARKLSMGSMVPIKFTCPKCKSDVQFEYDLDDVEMNMYTDGFPPELDVPVTLTKGFWVDGRRFHDVLLNPIRGKDIERVINASKINVTKAVTASMLATIKEVVGMDKKFMSSTLVEALSKSDYDELYNGITKVKYGPELSADVTCGTCESTTNIPLAVRMFSLGG